MSTLEENASSPTNRLDDFSRAQREPTWSAIARAVRAMQDSRANSSGALSRGGSGRSSASDAAATADTDGPSWRSYNKPAQWRLRRYQDANCHHSRPTWASAAVDAARCQRADAFMDTMLDTNHQGDLHHRAVAKTLPYPEQEDQSRCSEGFSNKPDPADRGHFRGAQKRVVTPCNCIYCQGREIPECKRTRVNIQDECLGVRAARYMEIREEAEDCSEKTRTSGMD